MNNKLGKQYAKIKKKNTTQVYNKLKKRINVMKLFN